MSKSDLICTFNLADCLSTLGLDEKGKVQTFVTNEVMRLCDPYVPFDEAGIYPTPGRLRQSVHIENSTDVVYNTPYARRLYYNPQYNFQGSPMRGAYWGDRMMQNGGREAIEQGARKVVSQ